MDETDWLEFDKYSEKYYKEHNFKQYESLSPNRHHLNLLWTKIKELLITTANKTVSCSYRSPDDSLPKAKSLTSCFSALKQLNRVLLHFRTKLLSRSLWPNEPTWSRYLAMILRIMAEHKIDPVALPPLLSEDNVKPVKKTLLSIYKLVYHKARLEQRLIEHKQIQHNIQI